MPLGVTLKQLVAPDPPPPALWVLGNASGGSPNTLFVIDPVLLTTQATISLPSNFQSFRGCVIANEYVWIGGLSLSSNFYVLQYSFDGGLVSNIHIASGQQTQLVYDGVNTIYVIGSNIYAVNVDTTAVTTIENTYNLNGGHAAWDSVNSIIEFSEDNDGGLNVGKCTTGGVVTTVGVPSGYKNIAYWGASANGLFWSQATDSPSFVNLYTLKYDPVAGTTAIITPPAPAPPQAHSFVSLAGQVKYNSSRNTVYIAYSSADNTYTSGRVDALNPTTGVMTTIVNSGLTPLGATLTAYIETSGNSLWFASSGGEVSLIDLTTNTIVRTVTLPGGPLTQDMAYAPGY